MEVEGSVEVRRRKFSHLPLWRFTSVVNVLIAIDSLICISLWIAGGDTLYLEDSVEKFSFTHSTFDLACISAVRCVILVASFYYLEWFSLLRVSLGQHDKQRSSNRIVKFLLAIIFMVCGTSLLYAIVKGALIVRSIVQGDWNEERDIAMHITYKVLCIVAVIFPVIEFFFGMSSSWFLEGMIRAKKLRLLVNINGDVTDDEQPKKKVNIKRILLLAVPVSTWLLI